MINEEDITIYDSSIGMTNGKQFSLEITRLDVNELIDIRNDILDMPIKLEMWKRSYHESERCLIERGKIIQELKENQITVEDIKNREIVERLENRIYELGIIDGSSHILINELKTILGDRNE